MANSESLHFWLAFLTLNPEIELCFLLARPMCLTHCIPTIFYHSVLVYLDCYDKNTLVWVAKTTEIYFSHFQKGSRYQQILLCGENLLPDLRMEPSHCVFTWQIREISKVLKALIPYMRSTLTTSCFLKDLTSKYHYFGH